MDARGVGLKATVHKLLHLRSCQLACHVAAYVFRHRRDVAHPGRHIDEDRIRRTMLQELLHENQDTLDVDGDAFEPFLSVRIHQKPKCRKICSVADQNVDLSECFFCLA